MFREKQNALNENDSPAEYRCREALTKAGFVPSSVTPVSFHWSQLIIPGGDKRAAIIAYENLIAEEPENKSALEGLAYLYQTIGLHEKAQEYRIRQRQVEVSQYKIKNDDQKSAVEFLLAKTGEAPEPKRMPAPLIRAHFNRYADLFDELLRDSLNYQGPELVLDELIALYKEKKQSLDILDIGCGTGLIGEGIFEYARLLHGIDLSDEMLKHAEQRNVYDKLFNDDYLEFLRPLHSAYDVITAVDVLNYQGDLDEVFIRIAQALRDGGAFIFTIEVCDAENREYALRNTGRFQHHEDYIEKLISANGFQIIHKDKVPLREERGQLVDALLYSLKK